MTKTVTEKQEEQKKPSDDFLMKYIVGRTEWATMDNGKRVIVDVSDRQSRDYKPTLINGGWYMVNKKRFTLDSYFQLPTGNDATGRSVSNKKKNKANKKKKHTPA